MYDWLSLPLVTVEGSDGACNVYIYIYIYMKKHDCREALGVRQCAPLLLNLINPKLRLLTDETPINIDIYIYICTYIYIYIYYQRKLGSNTSELRMTFT